MYKIRIELKNKSNLGVIRQNMKAEVHVHTVPTTSVVPIQTTMQYHLKQTYFVIMNTC